MKIEVTFDRSAKKEFRDQCIQRLQTFVTQMKQKQDFNNTTRNSILSVNHYSNNTTLRETPSTSFRPQRTESILTVCETKPYKKQNSLACMEKQSNTFVGKDSRKENKMPEQNQSRIQESSNKFDINSMRESVDKILKKLDRNEMIEETNQEKIEQKLQVTNRKLDYLISCVEKKGIVGSGGTQNEQQGRKKASFEDKFSNLARRYYEIRERSTRSNSHVSLFSKSITSLEQTQDSVTFRQI